VYLLPIGFCIAGGAVISAVLMSIFSKRIPLILMVFCIIQTAGKSNKPTSLFVLVAHINSLGLGSMAAIDPENIKTAWAPMVLGLIGVGGVLLPCQVIYSIITPDELLGTGVALSIVVRMIGQVVGVSMFYNIFLHHVHENAVKYFAIPAIQVGFTSVEGITQLATTLTAGPLTSYAHYFPELDSPEKIHTIVVAGHELFKRCFPILYLISIAFGGAAIISSFFLRDINKFMDDHVAVLM
jgi:hypothetical protein